MLGRPRPEHLDTLRSLVWLPSSGATAGTLRSKATSAASGQSRRQCSAVPLEPARSTVNALGLGKCHLTGSGPDVHMAKFMAFI